MNLTESESTLKSEINDRNSNTENECDAEVLSVAENISRVRLTLEEIIANDNEASRQNYLSPSSSPLSETSSVSSSFPSETGSFVSTSDGSVKSGLDNISIMSSFRTFTDPFRGIDDEEFSKLDRYGFVNSKFGTISEREFMELERRRL